MRRSEVYRENFRSVDKFLRWAEDLGFGKLTKRDLWREAFHDETIHQKFQGVIEIGPVEALSSSGDIASGLLAPRHPHGLGGRRTHQGNPLNEEHLNTEDVNRGLFLGLKRMKYNAQAGKFRSLISAKVLNHREACAEKPLFHFEPDLLAVQTVFCNCMFYRGNPDIDTRHIIGSLL
jgi:hypothetical protein